MTLEKQLIRLVNAMYAKLITIDGSTKKTGLSYFYNGVYNSHYLLNFEKETDAEKRFESMAKAIWKILDAIRPNIIYIEETYLGNNAQTLKILTRIQGVVYAWCINNNCEFNTITPKEWRKILEFKQGKSVKREQLKIQAIEYVFSKYGIEVSDDEADAICISDAIIKKFS